MRPSTGADRSSRIGGAKQYQRVFARRVRADLGFISIHAALNGGDRTRLGLSIGRQVGSAVVRNRLKRLLREAFHLRYHQLPCGLDLVISARAHTMRPLLEYQKALVDESVRLEAHLRRQ